MPAPSIRLLHGMHLGAVHFTTSQRCQGNAGWTWLLVFCNTGDDISSSGGVLVSTGDLAVAELVVSVLGVRFGNVDVGYRGNQQNQSLRLCHVQCCWG